MTRHRVAAITDVPIYSVRRIEVEGEVICLAHAENGQFYAVADTCSHEEFSLSDGELWGLEIECPAHGSRFDLQTGEPHALPALVGVRAYPVSTEDGQVFIDI